MVKPKVELEKKTVSSCLDEAVTEFESLRDELNEWKPKIVDFINGTKKRRMVEDASEGLESCLEVMESWKTHITELDKLDKRITEGELQVRQYKYTSHPYLARQIRFHNARNCLEATSELLELLKEQADEETIYFPPGVDEALGELTEKIDKCNPHLGIYIPGMFE